MKCAWVQAAAGSGKTTFIIEKIFEMIESGVEPSGILCITFTNVAAIEIKNRIKEKFANLKSMPEVCTLHAFCKRMLEKYNNCKYDIISTERDMQIKINSLQQITKVMNEDVLMFKTMEMVNYDDLCDIKYNKYHLDLGYYKSRFGSITNDAIDKIRDEVFRLARLLKDDFTLIGMAARDINDQIYSIEDMYNKLYYQDGTVRKAIQKINNSNAVIFTNMIGKYTYALLSNEAAYNNYALNRVVSTLHDLYIKQKGHYVLFDELITMAIALLKKEEYKIDGIKHIFIDEAQDTSKEQWEMLSLLSHKILWDDASITIVGDDKQLIYSFNGANLSDYQSFKDNFEDVKEIELNTSYRSTSSMVALINAIFPENKHIPSIIKEEYKPLHVIDTKSNYYVECAIGAIKKIIEDGLYIHSLERNATYDDILILVQRRGNAFKKIEDVLYDMDIPIKEINYVKLHCPAIEEVINIAEFVLNQKDDAKLVKLFRGDVFYINEEEIFKICQKQNNTIFDTIANDYPKTHNALLKIIELSKNSSPYKFFFEILYTMGLKNRFAVAYIDQLLDSFLEIALTYATLEELVSNIREKLYKTNIRVQMNIPGVTMTTVHGAKGTESPIVVLFDACSDYIQVPYIIDDVIVGIKSIRIGDAKTLYNQYVTNRIAEQRRLMYVAITRAKDYLFLIKYQGTGYENASWFKKIYNDTTSALASYTIAMLEE